jgi:hypothetical protein
MYLFSYSYQQGARRTRKSTYLAFDKDRSGNSRIFGSCRNVSS